MPKVNQTIECVKLALKDADLEIDEINHVVLVGGGTYTPLIRTVLESFFGKAVNTDINPMEAGVYIDLDIDIFE